MTDDHCPTPRVTPETEQFWRATAENRLMISRCEECDLVYYYPRSSCPDCFSDQTTLQETRGTGEIYSYTVTSYIAGWPDDELPLVIAQVELDEGPRIFTNIVDCEREELAIGEPVKVAFERRTEDVSIPVFRLK